MINCLQLTTVDSLSFYVTFGCELDTVGRRQSMNLLVGDIIKMKKPHPCGSKEWELLRVGMDFRMKCTGCEHQVMLPRVQVEKNIRGIVRNGESLTPAQLKGETAGGNV